MSKEDRYDVIIIGGGLAGLSASILLARYGHSVLLFEKETYPFHKVCGEYLSMESWNFLSEEIGIDLEKPGVSLISKLQVTTASGTSLQTDLQSGGFGISRYTLDSTLKNIAQAAGVIVKEGCKVTDVVFRDDVFSVHMNQEIFYAKVCCGSWGKKSNMDVKWKRPFIFKNADRQNNYVGIKYHVTASLPADTVMLHNFTDGYCGVVKIEGNKYCVCWFSKASNLKKCGGSVERTEKEILYENPFLKKLFQEMNVPANNPETISQVSLSSKKAVENHVLMVGDAAGMISPLCGNGMSMAMHGAKLAAGHISLFLAGNKSRALMEKDYSDARKKHFGTRMNAGRVVQYFFGRSTLTEMFIRIMKHNRVLRNMIINITHGKSF